MKKQIYDEKNRKSYKLQENYKLQDMRLREEETTQGK